MEIVALIAVVLFCYSLKRAGQAALTAGGQYLRNSHQGHQGRLRGANPGWSDAAVRHVALGRTLAGAFHVPPAAARGWRRGWSEARQEFGQGRDEHKQWLEQHRAQIAAGKTGARTGAAGTSGQTGPHTPGQGTPGPGTAGPAAPAGATPNGPTPPGTPGQPGQGTPGQPPAPAVPPGPGHGAPAPWQPPVAPTPGTPTAPRHDPDSVGASYLELEQALYPGRPGSNPTSGDPAGGGAPVVPWSAEAPEIGPVDNGVDIGKVNARQDAVDCAAAAGIPASARTPEVLEQHTEKVAPQNNGAANSGAGNPEMVVPWHEDAPAIGPFDVDGYDEGKIEAFDTALKAAHAATPGESAMFGLDDDALAPHTRLVPSQRPAAANGGSPGGPGQGGVPASGPPPSSSGGGQAAASAGDGNAAGTPPNGSGHAAGGSTNGGTPMSVTGETSNFDATNAAYDGFGAQVAPVMDAADQMVASLQSRGVDADTVGDATRITELTAQLRDAVDGAKKAHTERHGGLNEAHHAAPVRAAEREYYEGG